MLHILICFVEMELQDVTLSDFSKYQSDKSTITT